jgi:hypothetical protein
MYSSSMVARPTSTALAAGHHQQQNQVFRQHHGSRTRPAGVASASFNGVPLSTTATASPASIGEQLQQQLPSIQVPTDLNVDLDTAKEVRRCFSL